MAVYHIDDGAGDALCGHKFDNSGTHFIALGYGLPTCQECWTRRCIQFDSLQREVRALREAREVV